ncbi:MAG: hypothetical protein WCW13_02410 [archaeon]|jgi:hypothetical protein
MLGFILSKMQMLLFAVGIAIVALLFFDFVSRVGLSESAKTLLITNTKVISDQINNDLLCSDKFVTLPDALTYGYKNDRLFYDLEFSKQQLGDNQDFSNLLILRIVEHKPSNSTAKKNIIGSNSFISDAEFVLIDPGFLPETAPLEKYYNSASGEPNTTISLYPRASSKTSVYTGAPDSYSVVKEVVDGKKKVYIIPCTSERANNCVENILRVGCYKLKTSKGSTPNNDDLVPSCFNKSSQVGTYSDVSRNYTWKDCVALFGQNV